jgi:ribosomal protein S18 acetylase RimI-like enzyme
MKPIRQSWRMVIDLPNPPATPKWPQGITLRDYNHPQDAVIIYRLEDDIFQDHWGFIQQPFESGFKRWLHHATGRDDFDPTLWTLAMDGDEIAGLLRCRPQDDSDPEMGWVSVLGVRRPWRGRGLGLALLLHAFGEFHRRGKQRAGLGVDSENLTGATRLYEKAGMHIERQYSTYELELRRGREMITQTINS